MGKEERDGEERGKRRRGQGRGHVTKGGKRRKKARECGGGWMRQEEATEGARNRKGLNIYCMDAGEVRVSE